jgi:hypothetical protein
MPVKATRLERRMRGGAQAHLLACDDGRYYVTKFVDNPQHRRILVNEWTVATLLRHLGISTPEVRVVDISAEFLAANPDVVLQLGSGHRTVTPGWHFGSLFPGDPRQDAVYDYLPDTLLPAVANLPDFAAVLAVDKWTANSDSRQAIFFRRRLRDWLDVEAAPTQKGFIAQMVDHGYAFDGPQWAYHDSPIQGLYFRPLVYAGVRSLDDFQPVLDRIRGCPEAVFDDILRRVPEAWTHDDGAAFEHLIEQLYQRRARVADLVLATVRARPQCFPAWRQSAGA